MATTRPCTPAVIEGRKSKAEQFMKAAEIVRRNIDDIELADALITLAVHAGIAASDVICCTKSGVHPSGPNHFDAIQRLAEADTNLARELKVLLSMKGKSGYGEDLSSKESAERAFDAATVLVKSAMGIAST